MAVVYSIARSAGPYGESDGRPLYAIVATDAGACVINPDGTPNEEKNKRYQRLMKIAKRLPDDAFGWVSFFDVNMTCTSIEFPVVAESEDVARSRAMERMAEWQPPADAQPPGPHPRRL